MRPLLQPSLAVQAQAPRSYPLKAVLPALVVLQVAVLASEQHDRAGHLGAIGMLFVLLRAGATVGAVPLVLALARRGRSEDGRFTTAHALVVGLAGLAGALVAESVFYVVLHFTVWPDPRGFWAGYRQIPLTSLGMPSAMLVGIAALDAASIAAELASARQATASRLLGQTHQARLELLRAQLHPHFLFNSLNSVVVLARQDPSQASRILRRLERLFRASLGTEEPFTSLAEELGWVRDYLDVETCRFSDRLRVELSATAEARAAVLPRLLLQPLLENALRHGVGRLPGPGFVRIRAGVEGGSLVVTIENNGAFGGGREGFGLTLTRRRLREAYGGSARLTLAGDGRATRVTVRLPWRAAGAPHRAAEGIPA